MNCFQLSKTFFLASWALSLGVSGLCQTLDAAMPPVPKFGILPASVLRNESTQIGATQVLGIGEKGWAGLVCGVSRCELRPIRLEAKTQAGGQMSVVYPVAGRRPVVRGEYTIALVRGFSAFSRAEVPTWFTLRTPRSPLDAANGSLGISIQVPGQSTWRLMPRWAGGGSNDFVTFHLETERLGQSHQRQALGRVNLEVINAGIKAKDVLIWAGDLDGDGKIDLITRTGPNSSQPGLQLWLSGQAQGQQLVGPAAELTDWADIEEALGC